MINGSHTLNTASSASSPEPRNTSRTRRSRFGHAQREASTAPNRQNLRSFEKFRGLQRRGPKNQAAKPWVSPIFRSSLVPSVADKSNDWFSCELLVFGSVACLTRGYIWTTSLETIRPSFIRSIVKRAMTCHPQHTATGKWQLFAFVPNRFDKGKGVSIFCGDFRVVEGHSASQHPQFFLTRHSWWEAKHPNVKGPTPAAKQPVDESPLEKREKDPYPLLN